MLTISKSNTEIKGEITLEGSKSISNRVLIIKALCDNRFEISNLAKAKDTQTLELLLQQPHATYNTGHAGTTYRFLTAFLALKNGEQLLTGSERMKQRPIGALVDALRELGANIDYVDKEGYPPLRIGTPSLQKKKTTLSIPAHVSSQFVSALLLIAPYLPGGIQLRLEGKVVSRPYIEMTLSVMRSFGAQCRWRDNIITIAERPYQAKDFIVEADWSAASYFYEMAALSSNSQLQLNGVFENSIQGDQVIADLMEPFGVLTKYNRTGVLLTKNMRIGNMFEQDFIECPDIAQTMMATCAGTGQFGVFRGLDTLAIKETDRIVAMKTELNKLGVALTQLPASWELIPGQVAYSCKGLAKRGLDTTIFETYKDHRMAMALAPLCLTVGMVKVIHPEVVQKSYPSFWEDLESIGFEVSRA